MKKQIKPREVRKKKINIRIPINKIWKKGKINKAQWYFFKKIKNSLTPKRTTQEQKKTSCQYDKLRKKSY